MKLIYTLLFFVLSLACFAQPANDDCSGAQNLGSLPTPVACPGSGLGATKSVPGTLTGATPGNPYVFQNTCSGTATSMASPALDVWYSFTATGFQVTLKITGSVVNPNIAMYSGTCGTLGGGIGGCAIGTGAGAATLVVDQMVIGQSYMVQISGNSAGGGGNFTLTASNSISCTDCMTASTLTVNPPPVNGAYKPGTTVNFCYHVDKYAEINTNWLHGVQLSFGSGWNAASLVTSPAVPLSTCASHTSSWKFYPGGTTSNNNGSSWPAGWYYEECLGDNNPGNNFGDDDKAGTALFSVPAGVWSFCFSLTTKPVCSPGSDLSVTLNTSGDGESGNWSDLGCVADPPNIASSIGACCAPTMASTPTCTGQTTGTATATPVGANGPFVFSWDPGGQTTQTATGLAAGTFTVYVTDKNLCQITNTIAVGTNPSPTATTTPGLEPCFGDSKATASVLAAGGTGAYTFAWAAAGGTAATTTLLPAGSYTCTITDNKGCSIDKVVAITDPAALTATSTPGTELCSGGNSATVSVNPSGGTGTYTFAWAAAGGTGQTSTVLPQGSYTCTITDNNGCKITKVVAITEPTVLSATGTPGTAACGGTATVTVNPAGGTGAYTFAWAPTGGTGQTSTALPVGSYTCTITDHNGCSTTQVEAVTSVAGPTATGTPGVAACGGTATVSVNPSGGTGAYTFSWASAGGTGQTSTPLPVGTYTCTISDHNGCTVTQVEAVTSTAGPSATGTPGVVLCNGGTSVVSVTPSGGTGAYTYSWTAAGGAGQTSAALPVGTYTCTITDNNGCSTTQVEAITGPTALTATNSQTNVLCNGASTGLATVNPSGGTGAYTFSWAPSGGTAASASGLPAASYVCTITDHNGCSTTSGVTLTQPGVIGLSTSTTPAGCGIANGIATVVASGGAGGFSFAWTPSGGTAATTTGVVAGTYTITVQDANSCTQSTTAAIANTGGPTAVIGSSTNILCHGGNTGSATVTTAGGSLPYTFSWAPTGGAGATASGLIAGAYTVTVTDNGGCQATASVTLTEPNALTLTNAKVNASCFGGNNGTASVNALGGTGVYTYSWAPSGGTAFSATGLIAGNYTCSVTDHNGCPASSVVVVGQSPALSGTIVPVNELCNGGSTGSATITPTGGTGSYTFSWTPSGGTAATASALAANTYSCTLTDANGCTNSATTTIGQPALIGVATSSVNSTCGAANGTATAVAIGGTGAYTYSWAPTGGTAATTTLQLAGTYTVTVTDVNGCTKTATIVIGNSAGPTLAITALTNVTCNGACNGSITVAATAGTGTLTYSWTPSGGNSTTASALCPGLYTCTATDANGCSSFENANIIQTNAVVVNIPSSVNVLCSGGKTGSATSSASGGTGALNYSWTPSGGTSAVATGLAAGLYTITVKDVNGCSQKDTITIHQPAPLTVSVAGLSTTCNGKCDGTLICIPAGGVVPYTYSWSTGCTAASCNNVCIGTYTITTTDGNGCSVSGTTSITQPTPILLSMFTQTAHCLHSDGTDSVSVSGGTFGYTYSWSPGAGSASSAYHNIPPGMYTVTVTDKNNCIVKDSIQVPNALGVIANIVGTLGVTCFGGKNGSAQGGGTGGALPYSFSWTPGTSTTDTALNLSAGAYIVTVKDAKGCTSSATAIVAQPSPVVVAPMPSQTLCIGQCLPLTATGSGGSPGYTYAWSTIAGPATIPVCPVVTTTYSVVATDKNGCVSLPAPLVIPVNPPLLVIATHDTALCPGGTTALLAKASGGNGNYSYTWSTALGLSSSTISNPSASPAATTVYTVTLTDNCGTPSATSTVTVTIYPSPVVVFDASDTSGCMPLCITFNEVSFPACANAVWSFGDGKTGNGCANITHCYTAAGLYSVSLNETDLHGCPATASRPNYINVYPVPVADFNVGPQPATIVNSEMTFTDLSVGASSWAWNFGDLSGATSLLQNPHYTYPDTGCFTSVLTVTNTFGCKDVANKPLCIRPDFTFYAPNAFTPNDDGINDLWMPKGLGIDPANYHLMMFDRWGNLMWETRTWGQGWDGKANNGSSTAQIDTYIWKVDLADYLANKHSFNGVCNLIH
jgi:gliding motility-associated-like protein